MNTGGTSLGGIAGWGKKILSMKGGPENFVP